MSFKQYLNENADSELGKLSWNLRTKSELRQKIFELYPKLNGIETEFFNDTDPARVAIRYQNIWSKWKNNKDFQKLMMVEPKGMGMFEVLMAFLGDNITANGGAGDFDLNIGKNKIEVKMVLRSPTKGLHNFRLGVNSTKPINKAIKDLSNLALAAAKPNETEKLLSDISKGTINTSVINKLREVNISRLQATLDFQMNNKADVFSQRQKIGNIKDAATIKFLLNKAKSAKLKSVEEIERELGDVLGKAPYGYYFFLNPKESKKDPGMLYYIPKLDKIQIGVVTQGKAKINVPID